MRRRLLLLLGVGALLLTPGASGGPNVPGDPTPPEITLVIYGTLGANGWYVSNVTLVWTVAEPEGPPLSTSGCDATTLTADTVGTTFTCSATSDGGTTIQSKTIKLDKTAPAVTASPARAPDSNGWYNHTITVSFAGTDATSGIDVCTAPQSYSGPDSASASVNGSCRDRAGNSTARSFALSYDATAPQVTGASPARPPDRNGWYSQPVTFAFQGTDATSGIDSCPAATYAGPDGAGASVSGSCLDRAGNTTVRAFALDYDATAPQVTPTPARVPDSNGWYNHALTVTFTGSDATSGLDSCVAPRSYSGPDRAGASVSGSCLDRAGNTTVRAFTLDYDATAPQVTGASPARPPDANGWYNHALTVSFVGADATSGIDACSQPSYAGPDSASASASGSCRDRAGNQSGPSAFALSYDATGPQMTASPARVPDSNGWYNHALTVTFTGSDATSGLDSCVPPRSYSGPDRTGASVSGSCVDRAGNTTVRAFTLDYDAAAPQVTATPARVPDSNGWYNHALTVSFAGTDATSGIDVCTAPQSYSGPDSASASVSGSCRDQAGNSTARSFGLSYDATAPQVSGRSPARPPDANGWYNHALTVSFTGTDATSGIDGCSQPSYSGPDSASASVSGSCRDRAGNQSGSSAFALSYDATGPQVTSAIAVRPPDLAGWYNREVSFAFLGSDATSGIDSCPPTTYGGPDGADASVAGSCLDVAGNLGARSFPLRYDATGPRVSAEAGRAPDANGWYNSPLATTFTGSDAISGVESCSLPQSYAGPDSSFAAVGGSCVDKAGNVGLGSLPLKYDATAPQVSGASPGRAPDANGWFNHPLTISFQGIDATSGVGACTEASYAGPDNADASVTGSCSDRAGNQSGSSGFVLKYDATAPALTDVSVKAGDRTAVLHWRASADTSLIEIVRSSGRRSGETTVYRGAGQSYADTGLKNRVKYRYEVSAYDDARNAAERSVFALPRTPLYSPPPDVKVASPPLLAWTPVENAKYYNVQVWRGRRIFSAWPSRPSLRLKRSWTYEGRRYRLTPGRYRWYVWPAFGGRGTRNFGRLLGGSSFVVTAPKR